MVGEPSGRAEWRGEHSELVQDDFGSLAAAEEIRANASIFEHWVPTFGGFSAFFRGSNAIIAQKRPLNQNKNLRFLVDMVYTVCFLTL